MKINHLKLAIIVASFILFACGAQGRRVQAYQSGPPTELTGAPGEQDCSSSGCHTGSGVNSGVGILALPGLPASYRPNQEIDVTVTLTQANRARFGFELTAIDDQGRKAGELIVTDTARTQKATGFVGSNQREYIVHTFNGTIPNGTNQANQGRWTMRWKAPAQTVGRVTFYVAGNAANGNGQQSGDFIYTTSASMQAAAALPNVASVSAASFAAGALATETITAAFGTSLSQNVVVATTVPLPTELDSTQVIVRDAFNIERNAPLFFVSPAQINYLVPQGVFPGAATVIVRRSGADVGQGAITIEATAPALFAANANGQGVAAAVVLRVHNGQQLFEPVSRAEGNSQVPIPIDLGPESDQVYLLLFGTGFRNSISGVSVTVGGTSVPVLGYAAVAGLAGLDQCNIDPLPRSFAGRGNVNIVLATGTKTANTVSVNVK